MRTIRGISVSRVPRGQQRDRVRIAVPTGGDIVVTTDELAGVLRRHQVVDRIHFLDYEDVDGRPCVTAQVGVVHNCSVPIAMSKLNEDVPALLFA